MLNPVLLSALMDATSTDAVSIDDEARERFSFDALGPSRLFGRDDLTKCRVDAVVRPVTTEQVSQIMRLATQYGVPVIPYGGGTGVMGAVIPVQGGISLDMCGMDGILEMLPRERLVRVQPGVLLERLDTEAEGQGLMLGHDPWSVPIATIGGAISTDSVGYRAGRYGSMGKQVRALEVVLADGQVVRTRPLTQASSGPSMAGLFAGTEGTMGVITEATVQLFPQPEDRRFATFGFDSFEAGFPAVERLFGIGLSPAVLDLTEEDHPPDGAGNYHCVLYLVFEGFREEVEAQYQRSVAEALACGGTDLGPGVTEGYWRDRHAPAERWKEQVQHLRPTERWLRNEWRAADYLHVSLPTARVLGYKRRAEETLAAAGLTVSEAAVWTHLGLFSLLIMDPQEGAPGRNEVVAATSEALLTMAVSMGGGIEYCHGTGSKLAFLAAMDWSDALPLAQRIKRGMDPDGLLNPGKLGL
jgi:FAD/FMN-containing dehydrogenase